MAAKLNLHPKEKWYASEIFGNPPFMLAGAFEEYHYYMDMHMHDFFEICLALGGNSVHHTDKGAVEASKGSLFIIPPGILHGFEKCQNNDAHVINLFFHRSFFVRYRTDLSSVKSYPALFTSNSTVDMFLSEEDFNFLSPIALFLAKNNTYRTQPGVFLNSLGLMFITALCNLYSKKHEIGSVNIKDSVVMNCIEYMNDNISENITAEQLCNMAFCSGATLRRDFEALLGMSPLQYLQQLRLQKAIELLQCTDMALCDVAQQCGYYDSAHFSKKFRSHMGLSPKEYRKKYGAT